MSNSNSPKSQKRHNEDDEPREFTDFVVEPQNDTNMMEILKRIDSQMTNLTKDVVSIKNQIDDHIQNCSSESENMTEQNKTIENFQTQLETVNINQWNRFLNPRNWSACEIILIFLVFSTYTSFEGALVITLLLLSGYCIGDLSSTDILLILGYIIIEDRLIFGLNELSRLVVPF